MSAIIVFAKKDYVKQLLQQQNYIASDPIVDASIRQASVRARDIYTEAERTPPTAIDIDKEFDEHVAELASHIAKKKMADTIEGKRAAEEDIKDAIIDLKLHAGIVDTKQEVIVSDPKFTVGPTISSLGDAQDDDIDA